MSHNDTKVRLGLSPKNYEKPVKVPKQNLGLALRLICYRKSRTDDLLLKKKLADQMSDITMRLDTESDNFPTVQSEIVPKPALVELISAGPRKEVPIFF